MATKDFKDKKIGILGLGIEGLSSAKFLSSKGADVTLLDSQDEAEMSFDAHQKIRKLGFKTRLGKDYDKNLTQFDILVRTPGITRNTKSILEAEKKGVEVTSQTKIFMEICPCPVIGVTGTKGKGTTSTLIYEMLKEEGFDSYLGGNIGIPPFEFFDKLSPDSKVVLEMSSFQLLDLDRSPHIGVILMVTSEHLNYHKDINEYIEAKRNIVKHQGREDYAIINRDYPASHESDIHAGGSVLYISRERMVDNGCFVKDEKVIVKIGEKEDEIIDVNDVLLPGRHNLENVCAAVMAAYLSGVSKGIMVSVLKNFKGLEHRLELVDIVSGVYYYDDSFSTTPETAIAAIEAFEEPEILILGGSSKKSNFEELGEIINSTPNIKAIIGIGDEWLEIKKYIKNSSILIIEGAQNMEQIVRGASKLAVDGDIVLLTPACASFGMFKNYKDRGNQFKEQVKNLRNLV